VNNYNENQNQVNQSPLLSIHQLTKIKGNYKPNEKIQLYVMWQIYNKRYTIGSKLFYDDIIAKIGGNKSAYAKARMFLEGAGLIVDEVVIADKVPNNLVERFGLIHEQTQSKN
jgi:hypothetical protein